MMYGENILTTAPLQKKTVKNCLKVSLPQLDPQPIPCFVLTKGKNTETAVWFGHHPQSSYFWMRAKLHTKHWERFSYISLIEQQRGSLV